MSPRLAVLIGICLTLPGPAAAESPAAKPLTAEQKEKLKEAAGLQGDAARLFRDGKSAEGLAAWQKKVRLEKEVYGPDHDRVLSSLRTLARLHEVLHDYPRAAEVRRQVLEAVEGRWGKAHWQATDARLDLKRIGLLKRLVPDQRKQLLRAEQLNLEVHRLWQSGRSHQALPLARQALQIRSDLLGPRDRQTAQSLFNLGAQYQALRRWEHAKQAYRKALSIQKEALGEKHPSYAQSLNNLAGLYKDLGHPDKALTLYRQALTILNEVAGERDLSYATSLSNLAALHQDQARYAQALPLFLEAREIFKDRLGDKHPHSITSLNWLAGVYQAQAKYPQALALYLQARDLTREVRGDKHLDHATSLRNLAGLYQNLGEYAKALPLYEQARDLTRELAGEKHPQYAQSLSDLAGLDTARGDYARALALYQQALAITKEAVGEKHPQYTQSLTALAQLHYARGDYAQALTLLRKARDLTREVWGDRHPRYATCLNGLALLYNKARGDYARALALYQQALAITREALGEKHPAHATSLNNLGALYLAMGEYGQALTHYRQALAIRKEVLGDKHPEYAISLNNLALLYQTQGDYANALPLYLQAREINQHARGEKHPSYATTLNNLAALYQDLGDSGRALSLFLKARDIRKEALGDQHPLYADCLNNLAALYQEGGEYGKALPLLVRARNIRKEALGDQHPHYAITLHNLAGLHQDRGEYARALPLFLEARDLYKRVLGNQHPLHANCLYNLALLHHSQGMVSKAEGLARDALTVHTTLLRETLGGLGERPRLRLLATLRGTLHAWLSLAPAHTTVSHQYAAVLEWRGAASTPHTTLRLARRQPDLAELTGQLTSVRSQLATLAFRAPAPAQRDAWLRQLNDLRNRKEEVEGRLAEQSRPFRRALARRTVTPEAVASALPEGTALVDFLVYNHSSPPPKGKHRLQWEPRLLAFVLRKGHPPRRIDLGPAQPIAEAIRSWRGTLLGKKPADLEAMGKQLRQAVWQKVEPYLGGAKTVLLAPDGALCSLPFAALPGRKEGTYLLEEYTLGYLPSGRHLLDVIDPLDDRKAKGLLAAGDIAYGEGPFLSLPGTAPEANRCREVFAAAFPREEAALLTQADASEAKVKEALGKGPRFVHLATHGFFESPARLAARIKGLTREEGLTQVVRDREEETFGLASLLKSGIALAGASQAPLGGEAEDGILTAEEVKDLDLGGCELVTLSACQTALGQIEYGEGVMGLQRAFHAAGAQTVVASLWHVDDAATSLLMQEFYHQLWVNKRPKLEALRQAQLALLKDPAGTRKRAEALRTAWAKRGIKGTKALPLPEGGKVDPGAKTSHPALWAAFVLSGDWR